MSSVKLLSALVVQGYSIPDEEDSVFALEELCEVLVGLFVQPVEETPLKSSLQCGDCSPKLGIICKVPETALCSRIQIVNKGVGTLRDATRNPLQIGLRA